MAVSLIVRGRDTLQSALLRLMRRQPPPTCVVLYYHSVPRQQRELFARQMDVLLQIARPLPTDPPAMMKTGQHYVAVTFDDGYVSVQENAAPELNRRKIPWTVFVPSGCLGQPPSWLRHAVAARLDRVMTPEELRALIQDPLVTVGSHTVAHTQLVEVGPEVANMELARSKVDLEQILSKPVDQFSYPFGVRTPALDQQARALGYRHLFSSSPALAFRSADEFVTGRVSVAPNISLLEFRLRLLGAYRWLARDKE